jgi:hypothetical protein
VENSPESSTPCDASPPAIRQVPDGGLTPQQSQFAEVAGRAIANAWALAQRAIADGLDGNNIGRPPPNF